MLTFDLFNNAVRPNFRSLMLVLAELCSLQSLKVKSGYIEHLRRHDLFSDRFLPQIFNILGLYGGIPKAFKLNIWSIEEFYLDCTSFFLPSSVMSLLD